MDKLELIEAQKDGVWLFASNETVLTAETMRLLKKALGTAFLLTVDSNARLECVATHGVVISPEEIAALEAEEKRTETVRSALAKLTREEVNALGLVQAK